MTPALLVTSRPVPSRLAPAVAGSAVILFALPIFALAGWPMRAWALAAVLWFAALAFALLLTRLSSDPDNLAAASMRGIGTTSRSFLVGVPLLVVAVTNETVGIAAATLYAVAFTVELAVGLTLYFGGGAKA